MSRLGHHHNLRPSSRLGSKSTPTKASRSRRRVAMSTVSDALDATAAASAAATAAVGRLDAVEQCQLQMTNQLTGIAQQLQALLGGDAGGSDNSGGAGSSSGGAGGGVSGGSAGSAMERRRIDTFGLEKLHADISLPQLRTWRNCWGDFCQLNQLATYPVPSRCPLSEWFSVRRCSRLWKWL